MKLSITLVVAVGLAIGSCSRGRNTDSSDEISGAYFREYSFKVVNPETGAEIGMRTIRDTIFIKHSETDYEVSNGKWRLNDYDKEGWQSMRHSEDRPFTTYVASFDKSHHSLTSQDDRSRTLSFKLDAEKTQVLRGTSIFTKVE